jgi:creatinine amidohydrolase
MKKHQLKAYSWEEVSEMEREKQVVLVPLGSVEQEGTHLPLGVDTYVAEALADAVAKSSNSLAGPSLPIGYSEWFFEFEGVITLKMETVLNYLREYCASLIGCGFKKFIFVNGHAGNTPAVDVVARELIREHDDVKIVMASVWQIANSFAKDMAELKEKKFTHAGEIMTSVMMYLHPETVDMERAKAEFVRSPRPPFVNKSSLGGAEFKGIGINFYDRTKNLTESGIMGDPMAATSEKGEIIFKHITSYLAEMVGNL